MISQSTEDNKVDMAVQRRVTRRRQLRTRRFLTTASSLIVGIGCFTALPYSMSFVLPTSSSLAKIEQCPSSDIQRTQRYVSENNDHDHVNEDSNETNSSTDGISDSSTSTGTRPVRQRVKQLAKRMLLRPLSLATTVPMPSAIAAILQEASLAAVEQVEDSVINATFRRNNNKKINEEANRVEALINSNNSNNMDPMMIEDIIDEAFAPVEASLDQMELSLQNARMSLQQAKQQSYEAIQALQMAAMAQAEAAATTVAQVEQQAQRQVMAELYSNAVNANVDVSTLTFEDVDYSSSEMAPPFLDPDSCLVPGEPVVRVEKAPENSRRIFAGIDILASVDDVWKVLTDYGELQNVVPNLVVNEVLELYDGSASGEITYDGSAPEEVQCKQIAQQMKGALLRQVGGAKVAGIRFSAKTTLEVREWPQGLPDFAHFTDDMWEGKSRDDRAKEYPKIQLRRYRFPRPFALSSLPTRDISMQSIPNDDGEFRLYQGVWRMQPLPGCSPPGKQAMRLTYAVEISPRAYLPVQLVERRIVQDLCTNLEAIRNAVSESKS
ncbi:polyketide cyclase / dehydrase and lipid transport domain containing protein [Nitzschia inconspicua]|uniref:Polyketide cyclase / dehydrase and lipid transport domain containing protein n=1 Tax=Nitzschia inconspicua TaxID=303405 RepID=A0A9K3KMK8_9STRA|nr:polyketide cyclase / dehydrase and lipid transport domain containing protein [Nitzschia inconspicua]